MTSGYIGYNWRNTLSDFASIAGILAGFCVAFIGIILSRSVADTQIYNISLTYGEVAIFFMGVSAALFITASQLFLRAKESDMWNLPEKYEQYLKKGFKKEGKSWKKIREENLDNMLKMRKNGRRFYNPAIIVMFLGLGFLIASYNHVIAIIVAGLGILLEVWQWSIKTPELGSEGIRPKIYVIGVDHYSKKDGEKILKHAEELHPNTIFIESTESQGGIKKLALGVLRNPAFLIPYFIYSLIFGILKGKSLDLVYAKRASEKLGAPLHQIDDSAYEMVLGMHIVLTPISWAVVAIFFTGLVYIIQSIPVSLPFFVSIFWLFVLLFISFILFLRYGVSKRNQHMMDRIGNIMESSASKKIFLITGKWHVRDFKERLSTKYDVENLTGR